jgi:hypothetical protein
MAQTVAVGKRGLFATLRRDTWWVEPLLVVLILGAFVVYSTVSAVFLPFDFEVGPYLSPFYEPLLQFSWWPLSPAILILWAPLGFRTTCYYYRRAYYRSFFLNPPGCAVTGSETKGYRGEAKFPFILQNLHRYFLYVALVFNVFLWYGAIKAYFYFGEPGYAGPTGFGIGLGSLILTLNAFLLMMYSLSCHSFRHLIGGGLDCFSCSGVARTRKRIWDYVTRWNEHHRFWAWASLITVALTDVYIRLVASGIITDPHTPWGAFPLH